MNSDILFRIVILAIIVAAIIWSLSTANCPAGQKPVRGVFGFTCVMAPP